MSIYLSGTTFPNRFVRSVEDAAIFRALTSDGIYDGCAITASGSTLQLAAGRLIVCGRCCRVPTAQSIAVTGASSGYARLVLTLDMSGTHTETVFQQVRLDLDYSATLGGFDSLTQQDVNNGGTTYQIALAVVSLGASGITAIVSTCGKAHGRAGAVQLVLDKDDWDNSGNQTLRCDGVTSDTHVIPSYAPTSANRAAWQAAGIWLSAQSAGELTFSCDVTPETDITVNVLLS